MQPAGGGLSRFLSPSEAARFPLLGDRRRRPAVPRVGDREPGEDRRRTPAGILVRRVTFEYPDDLDAHWNPAEMEWSQVVNASSLLMPYLEPFLIQAVREAHTPHHRPRSGSRRPRATSGRRPSTSASTASSTSSSSPAATRRLREYEATLEADYDRIRAEHDPDFCLAYAAGFETMALAVGHMLVRYRTKFFKGADPAVSSLVLWHFVEELEHKHAAFGVYQHVVGSYRLRVKALGYTMFHTLRRTRQAYVMLLIEATGAGARCAPAGP